MQQYYYIENETDLVPANYIEALKFALRLKREDAGTGRIVVLVPTKSQYSLLSLLCPDDRCNDTGKIFFNEEQIPVFTLKTYRPFRTNPAETDILVAIALDVDEIVKFEHKPGIHCIIYIPWNMQNGDVWIKSRNAINIATGEAAKSTAVLDPWVKKAIDWLNITSYSNSGFLNPNDMNRLKAAANTLVELDTPLNAEAIWCYCSSMSLSADAINKIVESFCRARLLRWRTSKEYTSGVLKNQWDALPE